MALNGWLIDKSAYVRLGSSPDASVWLNRIQRGMVRLSVVTRLEIGYSFRTSADARREASTPPLSLLPLEFFTPAIEDRAVELQMLLTQRGHHRAASIPDLLLAATAEKRKLTVLAVHKDFDLIAALTGQPIESLRIG